MDSTRTEDGTEDEYTKRVPHVRYIMREFSNEVIKILGFHFDGLNAVSLYKEHVMERMEKRAEDKNLDQVKDKLRLDFHYVDGPPPEGKIIHWSKFGDVIERNDAGGITRRLLGYTALVFIYQLWEDKYRSLIAKAMKVNKGKVTSDLMGDIRRLRNSIIHNEGVARDEIKGNKIIKAWKKGDDIYIGSELIEFLAKRFGGEFTVNVNCGEYTLEINYNNTFNSRIGMGYR